MRGMTMALLCIWTLFVLYPNPVHLVTSAQRAWSFQWPELFDWRTSWEIERAYFWDAMPGSRLGLLGCGWIVILMRKLPRRMIARSGKLQREGAVPQRSAA